MTSNWENIVIFRYFLYLLALLAFGSIWTLYNTDNEFLQPPSQFFKSFFQSSFKKDSDSSRTEGNQDPILDIYGAVSEEQLLLNSSETDSDIPVIRSWTLFFKRSLSDVLSAPYNKTNCKYRCRFLDRNQDNYTLTDAYIFHSRNINPADLPSNRTSNQLFVLLGLESAYNFGDAYLKLPSNYFNATSTYRMNSDYPFPYFTYIPLKRGEKPMWTQSEFATKLKDKSGITVINSHCITKSRREKYIHELSRHINVTKTGACYKNDIANCPRYGGTAECRNNFLSQFKFYLAFENGACQDYVTEKYSYQTEMLVPIVLQRSVLDNLVPKDEKMFIAADDFATPGDLAEYLSYLEENDEEYLKYFDWSKRYRLDVDGVGGDAMCRLCEDIYKMKAGELKKKLLPDAKKFIVDEAKCIYGYAEALLPISKANSSTHEP